jgi:HEAT repeat protein
LTELVRGTEHENLRRRAAMALAETGDPRATPAIREALLRTSSPEEARHYLSALARVADEPALSTLFDYVSRAGTDTALRVLREVRNKDAAPYLAGELDPRGDATFQRALLRKLREFHDPRSLSELDRYLDRAPKPMMFEALRAVEGITDERAARLLEQFAGRADDPKLSQWALRSAARVRQKIAKAEQKGAGKPDKPKRPKTPRPDHGEKREQKESRRNGRTG